VPEDSLPVLLMSHEPDLRTWVHGLDATFVIGVSSEADLGLYEGCSNVAATMVHDGPMELSDYTIRLYSNHGWNCFVDLASQPSVAAAPDDPALKPALEPSPAPSPDGWVPDPLESLAAARPIMGGRTGAVQTPAPQREGWDWLPAARPAFSATGRGTRTGRTRHRWPGLSRLMRGTAIGFRTGRDDVHGELADLALAHTRGEIVSVVSLAGGVGKTAVAAALGIIYGEAVQDSGGSAAVIDQNVENPDQWGRLELDGHVRTVSEIMADIEAGRDWSIPAWNRTPALAIYPERRGSDGYPPVLIERLAQQLRGLHMMSVVDLPNCLPAHGPGRAGVAAGWLSVSDLVIIPTSDDPTRLQGVIELLDCPLIRGDAYMGNRAVPAVVAYVRSPLRAVREDRGVTRVLDQIRERVVHVVEIPRDERATLAVVRGQPITDINPALRRAYVELALTLARTLSDT
jgi:MinD-like ATPase involved in chromosome partitioning or flagellar assembly